MRPRGLPEHEVLEYFMPGGPPESGCWDWTGCCNEHGYGIVSIKGRMVRAHHVSYRVHVGLIPSGAELLHSCDRPVCIHPRHLSPGTHAENMADSVVKGRMHRGERSGPSKLTDTEITLIRSALKEGRSQTSVAAQFGVNQSTISRVANDKTWTHIKETT